MKLFQRREREYKSGRLDVSDAGIAERLTFLGLTPQDLGVVATWAEECRAALPQVSERFYEGVTRSAGARGLLEKHTSVAKQRPAMERYLSSLFDGRIDDAWLAVRTHVGKRHDDIDLDCMFYFGGYEVLRDAFGRAVESAENQQPYAWRKNHPLLVRPQSGEHVGKPRHRGVDLLLTRQPFGCTPDEQQTPQRDDER